MISICVFVNTDFFTFLERYSCQKCSFLMGGWLKLIKISWLHVTQFWGNISLLRVIYNTSDKFNLFTVTRLSTLNCTLQFFIYWILFNLTYHLHKLIIDFTVDCFLLLSYLRLDRFMIWVNPIIEGYVTKGVSATISCFFYFVPDHYIW